MLVTETISKLPLSICRIIDHGFTCEASVYRVDLIQAYPLENLHETHNAFCGKWSFPIDLPLISPGKRKSPCSIGTSSNIRQRWIKASTLSGLLLFNALINHPKTPLKMRSVHCAETKLLEPLGEVQVIYKQCEIDTTIPNIPLGSHLDV